jgi:hypothetical protein
MSILPKSILISLFFIVGSLAPVQASSFGDSFGNPYDNIIRYHCVDNATYERRVNLFIRSSEVGSIQADNPHYICRPYDAPGLPPKRYGVPAFALSLFQTPLFSIQVEAPTQLAVAGSHFQLPAGIRGDFYWETIGYAAALDASGHCPVLTDNQGMPFSTYPLERWTYWTSDPSFLPVYLIEGGPLGPPSGYQKDFSFEACAPAANEGMLPNTLELSSFSE